MVKVNVFINLDFHIIAGVRLTLISQLSLIITPLHPATIEASVLRAFLGLEYPKQ